ncbi:MAG: choice-of-anchor J domain-containing protein, partial [Candidatus Delongbacteria bacterium]|nr:choice-of-anchor J domain-containing protein [Candidatus Delongbacteria bacterium]
LTVEVKEDFTKSTNSLTIKPEYVVPSMNGIYKSLFINYEESKFANQLGEFGELLVLYTSRDATVIQPYITWKREKGFKVTATQITTGTNVKTTVQNAYNSNPNLLYVQLVGDWADIKSNTCSVTTSADPMDPDLGNVSGSDLYPELIVGRFSAATTTDVTTQVNKAINYEKYPDMSGTWYSTGLGIGSPDGSGIGDDGEIDYEHSDVIKENKLLPYTYDTVYEAYGSPTSTTVANYVNAGLGVINYTGHGDVTYWVTSGYSTTNINSSTNGSKLPFIFSVACINGAFHNGSVCFGEAWLRKSNGGAVATIMATINQPWVPPMRGQDYMNDILTGGYNYSTNPGSGTSTTSADLRTTFGSIAMNGNVLMLAEDYNGSDTQNTINTWTIFGDASIQIRTDTPKTLTASNTAVATGTAYSTNIKANSVNFQNALVSLYQNGNTFSGFTDLSGNVTINHSLVAGAAKLVVTGYNTETEYLDVTVDGGSTPPSTPTLVSPLSGGSTIDQTPTFDWADASGATSYTIQVDNNSGFTSPEINQTPSVSNYTPGSNLALGTYYWRVLATNSYGSSSYTSSWTITIEEEMVATLPFYENFNASTSLPADWQIVDNQGSGQVWQFGTHTDGLSGADGYYAYLNSDGYGSGNTQNTDLITPLIDMTGASNVSLAFTHYFREYTGSSSTLSYSINGGSTWIDIQSWTTTTTNPVVFNQVISAVAGQSQVKFKWNFAGTWGYYWDVDDIAITTDTPVIPPFASTLSASSIVTDGATLNGTVNANDESTTVTFEYGLTASYGSTAAGVPGTVTGSTDTAVSANLSGLSDDTVYNFRVKAVSAGGTTYGTNQTFATDAAVIPVDPPTSLTAVANDSDVSLSWTAPTGGPEPDTMNDGFEGYADFSLTCAPWTQIDGDGSATYGSTDGDFTNENYTGAYIIFNPSQATPALTGAWDPRTGSKYAACFAAQTPANDDWLISPELLVGSGYYLDFYARSLNDTYGLERFKVGVSTTGTSVGDFTIISSGSYVEAPVVWTNYNYDLSAYVGQAIYIAIVCVSNDAFVFMVDDVTVDNSKGEPVFTQSFETTPKYENIRYTRSEFLGKESPTADLSSTTRSVKSTLTGYKVYRDGSPIATIANPVTVTYDDLGLANGNYDYYVTATYSDPVQESDPSNTENVTVSTQFAIDSFPWEESYEGVTFIPDYWTMQSASANTWSETSGYVIGETNVDPQNGSKFAFVQW